MAKFRLRMLPFSLVALVGLMASVGTAYSPLADASTASPSPSADVELICHTDNPAECYPKVFQPTHEFQVVHDDQDLPQGLHVRLDVFTGKKEAKINVPDESDPALEGLPVDSSVVIVDRDQPEPDGPSHDQARLPPNAPAYDPAGKIKKPKSADAGEGSAFYRSLTILKKGLDVDGALEMLEDISHDIYYGLKIAEDYDTVHELSCLASSSSSAAGEDNGTAENQATRARLAALTLSSTVQNNPKALAEIERHWPKLSAARCPSSPVPLGEATFTLFPPSPSRSPNHHPADAAALTKARVSLLSGLLKSPALRRAFLASDGPSHLVRLLASSPSTSTSTSTSAADDDEAWAPAQRAAAFLLIDNFLDPDMGATLGEWPTRAQLADGDCAARDGKGGSEEEAVEECLDWHVQRIATKYKGVSDHWSHDLRSKLGKYRTAAAAGAAAQDESRKKLDL